MASSQCQIQAGMTLASGRTPPCLTAAPLPRLRDHSITRDSWSIECECMADLLQTSIASDTDLGNYGGLNGVEYGCQH